MYYALVHKATWPSDDNNLIPWLLWPGQLTQAAQADVPPAASVVQGGGSTPSEQRCTFLELSLALAGGLDTDCIKLLFTTAKGAMQVCCLP